MRSKRGEINAVSIPGFKGETSVYQNHYYYEQNRVFRTFVPNEIKIKCTCSGAQNRTNKLYFEHPEIILPILESRKEKALRDVEGLCRLFAKFGVPREAKILDLSCGIGRHSVPLSQAGYQVVGYDLSPLFLERAKELAKQKDGGSKLNKIRFYQGDSRHAARVLFGKGETAFDVIISMSASIGYFGEEEDLRMFKELLSLVSPNCMLVIETDNRDQLVRTFNPSEYYTMIFAGNEFEVHRIFRLNIENSFMEEEWKLYKKMQDNRMKLMYSLPTTLRVYSLHELKKIIETAGWSYREAYSILDTLKSFTFKSDGMILIAQRPF